jgi:hypothetical protein
MSNAFLFSPSTTMADVLAGESHPTSEKTASAQERKLLSIPFILFI